jgi:hypothetical protein
MLSVFWFRMILGRFHYHLESSRATGSIDQIMWTFSYAKSFVVFLCDLSSQIAISGQLKLLCDRDYEGAGAELVMGKSIKFMRAHIAHVISQFSLPSMLMVTQATRSGFVESCFEFDEFMCQLVQRNCSAQSMTTLRLSHIIYEEKDFFGTWIRGEHSCFLKLTSKALEDSKATYNFEFGNKTANSSSHGRCYNGLYQCIRILSIASKRYVHMPPSAQDIISEIILEPILLCCVGLCLMRIRTSEMLFALSSVSTSGSSGSLLFGLLKLSATSLGSSRVDMGLLSSEMDVHERSSASGSSSSTVPLGPTAARFPDAILDFRESVNYAQSCLSYSIQRDIFTKPGRFELNWNKIHSWIPREFVSPVQFATEYSPVQLVQFAMNSVQVHEAMTTFSNRVTGLENRRIVAAMAETMENIRFNPETVKPLQLKMDDLDNWKLASSVDHARAQIMTLISVLEKKYDIVLKEKKYGGAGFHSN